MNIESRPPGIAGAAKQLRKVRNASRQFLTLWALECMVQEDHVLDRVAADLGNARLQHDLADPFNHNWSLLYRGSVLDD